MINSLKKFDKRYPFVLILFLILLGSGLLYGRLMNYIRWPKVMGVVIIGEGLYLFYKRYLKKK